MRSFARVVLATALAVVPVACRQRQPVAQTPTGQQPPSRRLPETAPIEDAPTLRPTPTPPGHSSDIPGPP